MSMEYEESPIDFFHCEIDEFKDYIEDPSLSIDTLEEYVQQMMHLIDEQKAKDNKAAQPKELSPNFSVASSTTSSRHGRKSRSRRAKNTDIEPSALPNHHSNTSTSRRTRQHSRANKIQDEESDEDGMQEVHENTPHESRSNSTNPPTRQNSVEYDWMQGVDITDQHDDGGYSSDERLLNFDIKKLDEQDVELLLSDKTTESKSKSSKSSKKDKKKKKSKKHKKKKDRKKKKKSKSKRKSAKSVEGSDADYMVSSDDDDAELAGWNAKEFELEVESWSMTRLQKEAKSVQQQIDDEQQRSSKRGSKKKSKSPADDEDDDEEEEEDSSEEDLAALPLEQLQVKFQRKLSEISQHQNSATNDSEDPDKLYCVCKKPYDHTNTMIQCDYCKEWYHCECIGLAEEQISKMEHYKFKCPPCNDAPPLHAGSEHASKQHNGGSMALRRQRGRRNVIADSASDTDHGAVHPLPLRGASMVKITESSNDDEKQKQAVEKYQKIVAKLQERLRFNMETLKQKEKELLDRLSKAKHDMDGERQRRQSVEQHLETAENESKKMVQELVEKIRVHSQKENEMVQKLKKMETKCKKHKEAASEHKKKMKTLREEHQQRLSELEEEMIPTLNKRLKVEEEKYAKLHHEYQQQAARTQQLEQNYNYYAVECTKKLKSNLDSVSAELAKTQTEKAQMEHRLNTLHNDVMQHHQEWSELDRTQKEQIKNLEQKISMLQQQNNALRNGSNISSPAFNLVKNDNNGITLPRPPSPVKMPTAPAYLKFNELELEELKMCRELCQKLLEANLFAVEHMAGRANVTEPLFLAWVTGSGKSPTVINDLSQGTTLPTFDKNQHLSMNSIRMLLIEIRRHLEHIQSGEQGPHDQETLSKVKALLTEFHTASTTYEHKMNEFKLVQHQQLMEIVQRPGAVVEYYTVIGTNAEGQPKSDWIQATVQRYEQQASRVLIRKADGSMTYTSVDSAVLRIPENHSNVNSFANNHASSNNGSHMNHNSSNNSSESHHNTQNTSPATMQLMNGAPPNTGLGVPTFNGPQLNFNPMQALSTLPPFEQLEANKIATASVSNPAMPMMNPVNANNNGSTTMSQTSHTRPMNGAQHEPVVIDDNSDDDDTPKSASRKRKRDERSSSKSNKKKKHSSSGKHSKEETDDEDASGEDSDSDDSDDETEASGSEVSSGSDTESESESKKSSKKSGSKKKKKKKHHSDKDKKSRKRDKKRSKKKDKKHKHKEDKASSKSSKKHRSSKKKHDTEEARSISPASTTTSSRKRRGTKRSLSSSAKANGGNPSKKRKIDHNYAVAVNGHVAQNGVHKSSTSKSDFVVIKEDGAAMSSDQEPDKNDSNCRICKHPGNLVCCEGCPSAYHADCIRPRVKQEWLDVFEDWYCPSCAPRNAYIPLKDKKSGKKWPHDKEPLLQDLKAFLKRHPNLERDYSPQFHASRKPPQSEAAQHNA
eukprot:CAMPEP_0197035534 /NCGR_PEP_ID=MMETSP1384-20130603/13303_1 /TAXON_ID=29189 /ORGANISM="Ammonia sp." /LENGTH=1448 /DNA_ID=CAMNT_0042465607 /DNA_START=242 /DNA_END=4588 /DNA_ORIENTATION=+